MLTKRLEVRLIPKQCAIPTVRYDMVDHLGKSRDSVSFTMDTQRMLVQEGAPQLLPSIAIAEAA